MHRVVLAIGLLAAAAAFAFADGLPAPSGLSPADGADVREPRPVLSWDPVQGASTYEVWIGLGSGDVVGNLQVVQQPAFAIEEPLGENAHVYWRVRASDGQAGDWSDTADFWVGRDVTPPEAPGALAAAAEAGGARLTWEASPSTDAAGYLLYVRPEGGTYANPSSLGRVTETRVEGLSGEIGYDFMLTAVDEAGNESVGVVASLRPGSRVSLRGRPFLTIQAAADEAQPGETVELGAGTYREGVSLPPGVSLRGAGPGVTVIDATGFAAGVTLEASDASEATRSTLSQLTIRGGAAGVWGGIASVRLENVILTRVHGPGVRTDGGVLELARVTIAHCQRDGVDTGAAGSAVDALIFGSGGAGVYARGGAFGVSYSDLYANLLGNFVGATQGAGLLSTAAQFENEAAEDYRVLPGDPTVDAGAPESPWSLEPAPNGGRTNIGAFGNTPWATPTLAPAAGAETSEASGGGGSSSKSNSYCVVATAAFGSQDQASVAELRAFRDRVLRTSGAGQKSVGVYERAAAPVARQVGKSEVLRAVLRGLIK